MKSGIHLNGLNGIRAIAALIVVVTHAVQGLGYFGEELALGGHLAGYGVTMFFTLSGYLITYLLLKEIETTGTVDIKKFYIRRILRIWPLYYLYVVLVIITLFAFQRNSLGDHSLWFYIFFCANIPFVFAHTFPLLGHYWSLGVEEQFYLFWPWVIRKCKDNFILILGFALLLIVLKVFLWMIFYKKGNPYPHSFLHITRFHCMAFGACGAIMAYKKFSILKHFFHPVLQGAVWLVVGAMTLNWLTISPLVNDEVFSLLSVAAILNVSANPKPLITLEGDIFNYIGKISYGIYVYHPLVIFLTGQVMGNEIAQLSDFGRYLVVYVLIVGLTIGIAHLSYYYFETKFLLLKDRFTLVKSYA